MHQFQAGAKDSGEAIVSRKRHAFDPEATAAMQFADKRSYVTVDGKQFRLGTDMIRIREAVYLRDMGICQECKKPIGLSQDELDHFPLSRGQGGDDSMENLRIVHRRCHVLRHVRPLWTPKEKST